MKMVVTQPSLFYYLGEILAADEIRASVTGSGWGNMSRRRQAACSLFIEPGNGDSSSSAGCVRSGRGDGARADPSAEK